jgi:hypothetical protein
MDALLCGLGAGLAAGGNLALGYALGLPVLARLIRREGSWLPVLAGAAAGLGAVVATNPYLAFSPRDFAWELTVFSPARFGLPATALRAFAARAVPEGLGALLAVLAAGGVLRGLFVDARRRLLSALVLAGVLLVLLRFPQFAASTGALRLHYAAAALAVLLAVDLLAALPRPLAAVLFVLALADTGLRGGMYLANLRREAGAGSTREAAADWVDANVPAGASVGLLLAPEPSRTPPMRWDRLHLVMFDSPSALAEKLPEWIVALRESWNGLDESFRERYDEARVFAPARLPWAAPTDDAFFANAGMVVMRRAGPGR